MIDIKRCGARRPSAADLALWEMMNVAHQAMRRFEERAILLDIQRSPASVRDAAASLATWMDLADGRLTAEDRAVLDDVGAVLRLVDMLVQRAKKNQLST